MASKSGPDEDLERANQTLHNSPVSQNSEIPKPLDAHTSDFGKTSNKESRFPTVFQRKEPKPPKKPKPQKKPILPNKGYRELAYWMGQDASLGIFRRFNDLNMLRLLYLQAELVYLQQQLWLASSKEDLDNEHPGYAFSFTEMCDWQTLDRKSLDPEVFPTKLNSLQQKVLKQIKLKLTEYNNALQEVANLQTLDSPSKDNLDCFKIFVKTKMKGRDNIAGTFLKKELWEKYTYPPDLDDYITLLPTSKDPVKQIIISWYDKFRHRTNKNKGIEEFEIHSYNDSKFVQAALLMSAMAGALVPGLSILILYYIKTELKRIGTVIALTVGFAILIWKYTPANSVEIFAATAAFAAVEVVFVGSPPASNGTT